MFDQKRHPGKGPLAQGHDGAWVQPPGKQSRVEHELGGMAPNGLGTANVAGRENAKPGHHHEQEARMVGMGSATGHPVSDMQRTEVATASTSSVSGVNMLKLKALLAEHEGYRTEVYDDGFGNLTVGIGHKLPKSGPFQKDQYVGREQIDSWFHQDVAEAIAGAKANLGAAVYDLLDEERKYAIIDIVFNVGAAGFGEFHKLIQALRDGNYARAAHEIVDSELAPHRAREDAALMRERTVVVQAPPGTFPRADPPVVISEKSHH